VEFDQLKMNDIEVKLESISEFCNSVSDGPILLQVGTIIVWLESISMICANEAKQNAPNASRANINPFLIIFTFSRAFPELFEQLT
jgi:hypothetical protein